MWPVVYIVNQFIRIAADNAGKLQTIKTGEN